MRNLLAFAILVTTILLVGCSDDENCTCPGDEIIQGQVTGGAGPLAEARVEARYEGPDENMRIAYYCLTDSAGHYAFDVAPGEYRLFMRSLLGYSMIFYTPSGLTCTQGEETFFTVTEHAAITADFHLGAMQIDLQLPEILADANITLAIENIDDSYPYFNEPSPSSMGAERQHYLEGLIPGFYRVSLDFDLVDEEGTYLDYDLDLSTLGDSIAVLVSEISTHTFTIPDPAYATGMISGDWALLDLGLPAISLYDSDEDRVASTKADSTGAFSLPVFFPMEVRVRTGYGMSRWVGGEDFESATIFPLDPQQSLELDPFPVGGMVCYIAADSSWMSGARLHVYNETLGSQDNLYLDADDTRVAIGNASPGDYLLHLVWREPAVWRPQWYDRVSIIDQAATVGVDDLGGVAEVTITLEEGGRIRGRVLEADETPAVEVSLLVEVPDLGYGWNSYWRTDEEGAFTIEGLPDGEILLAARVYGEIGSYNIWYPGVVDKSEAEPVVIENASTITDVEWVLIEP